MNQIIVFSITCFLLTIVHCNLSTSTDAVKDNSNGGAWSVLETSNNKSEASTDEDAIRRQPLTNRDSRFYAPNQSKQLTSLDQVFRDRFHRMQKERSGVNKQKWINPQSFNSNVDNNQSISAWPWGIPKEKDYRELGYVSSVDDQKKCGCCWALVAVGAIEGAMKRSIGRMEKLSAQQVLDCTSEKDGCESGNVVDALEYVLKNGIQTAFSYPFEDAKKECRYNSNKVAFTIRDFFLKLDKSEKQVKGYVANYGPVGTVIVTTRSFDEYKGGIFQTDECRPEMKPDHGILIVGYGYEGARRYWILKNTYGKEWGEKGFIRFERKIGLCGIGRGNFWVKG